MEPRFLELELNCIPPCFPMLESIATGEEAVPSMDIRPFTPILSPSPTNICVPAWMTSTWFDSTKYPSGSSIIPLQTVVERGALADAPDSRGASRSNITSVAPRRIGSAIGSHC